MTEKVLGSLQIDFVLSLFGALDSHTDTIEKAFNVRIAAGENGIVITGENADNVQMAATVIEQLERISSVNGNIDINTVNYVVSMVSERKQDELSAIYNDCICLTSRGKPIKPKTVGQQNYVDRIKKNTIVFGVGPAGTGKTFPGRSHGGDGPQAEADFAHRTHPSRCGSGRKARLPAR